MNQSNVLHTYPQWLHQALLVKKFYVYENSNYKITWEQN